MSAFLCAKETFDAIVSTMCTWQKYKNTQNWNTESALGFIEQLQYDPEEENIQQHLARRLYALNLEALDQRYGDPEVWDYGYEYSHVLPVKTIDLYQAIGCLLYQCSEGNVPDDDLFKRVATVKDALAHDIVTKTLDYESSKMWH